jgi:hypothetical protein
MAKAIEEMNRDELRKAFKDAGISYAKMTAQQMREKLVELAASKARVVPSKELVEDLKKNKIEFEDTQGKSLEEAKKAAPKVTPQVEALPGMTPLGLKPVKSPDGMGPQASDGSFTAKPTEPTAQELKKEETEQLRASAPEQTPRKIEKNREERNGIKRPSAGTLCRRVWDALDAFVTRTGAQPTSKDAKQIGLDNGWNPNNVSIEFYQWRRFNGVTGRQSKPAAK